MSTEPRNRPGGRTAGESGGVEDVIEWCDCCGSETAHAVSIQIKAESDQPENAAFSRQPYRRSQCLSCDDSSLVRLNDAR